MYHINAYTSHETMDRGTDAETTADTLKEAKAKARHYISEDFRRLAEMSARLMYAQVLDGNGECVADFFGK